MEPGGMILAGLLLARIGKGGAPSQLGIARVPHRVPWTWGYAWTGVRASA